MGNVFSVTGDIKDDQIMWKWSCVKLFADYDVVVTENDQKIVGGTIQVKSLCITCQPASQYVIKVRVKGKEDFKVLCINTAPLKVCKLNITEENYLLKFSWGKQERVSYYVEVERDEKFYDKRDCGKETSYVLKHPELTPSSIYKFTVHAFANKSRIHGEASSLCSDKVGTLNTRYGILTQGNEVNVAFSAKPGQKFKDKKTWCVKIRPESNYICELQGEVGIIPESYKFLHKDLWERNEIKFQFHVADEEALRSCTMRIMQDEKTVAQNPLPIIKDSDKILDVVCCVDSIQINEVIVCFCVRDKNTRKSQNSMERCLSMKPASSCTVKLDGVEATPKYFEIKHTDLCKTREIERQFHIIGKNETGRCTLKITNDKEKIDELPLRWKDERGPSSSRVSCNSLPGIVNANFANFNGSIRDVSSEKCHFTMGGDHTIISKSHSDDGEAKPRFHSEFQKERTPRKRSTLEKLLSRIGGRKKNR